LASTATAAEQSTASTNERVGAKLLALAAGIWHNWAIDAPPKRPLIAYDYWELII
jgi:hypothetical protein